MMTAQQLFPPCNEADMGSRNLRMADMLTNGPKTARRDRLFEVLQFCRGFDYILTCNLLTAIFCFGSPWWEGLHGAGVFDGWDPIKETEDLASGGQHAHGLVLESDLDSDGILDRIHYLCEWERSGSSSTGRVEYEIDGERRRGHFKARKNLVLDVFPFEDLVTRVRQHDSQENKALVKSEFGKVRLAVSVPLEVYLQQGFLYGVSGSAYLSWPGNTLEESVAEEMCRTERTFVRMASGAYALPYDFARFDHRPTTDGFVTFQAITFDRALESALPPQRRRGRV
ncbi:hypothetical protein MTO96_046036 [Rhipicephalus appendiculatus]